MAAQHCLPLPSSAAHTGTNHGRGFWHLLHSEHLCCERSSDFDGFHCTQDTEQNTHVLFQPLHLHLSEQHCVLTGGT